VATFSDDKTLTCITMVEKTQSYNKIINGRRCKNGDEYKIEFQRL